MVHLKSVHAHWRQFNSDSDSATLTCGHLLPWQWSDGYVEKCNFYAVSSRSGICPQIITHTTGPVSQIFFCTFMTVLWCIIKDCLWLWLFKTFVKPALNHNWEQTSQKYTGSASVFPLLLVGRKNSLGIGLGNCSGLDLHAKVRQHTWRRFALSSCALFFF